MTKDRAHKNRIPFYLSETGKFHDYEHGGEYFHPHKFAGPFEGYCFAIGSVFKTWIDRETSERAWQCVCP